MTKRTFDINCDLGESFGNWSLGNDEEVMPLVTSANVACGFHGGDPVTMERTVPVVMRHGLEVGAHPGPGVGPPPGLPGLLGVGRRVVAISPGDAAAYVRYQAGALQAFLRAAGG